MNHEEPTGSFLTTVCTLERTSSIWELGALSGEKVIRTKHRLTSKTIEHVYYTWKEVEHHGHNANR